MTNIIRHGGLLLLGWLLWAHLSAQPVLPHPDNSPPLNNFYKMGVPTTDTLWSIEQQEKVVKLLAKIHGIDKYSLPRKDSRSSGPLFARIVATENLDYLVDRKVDIRQRLERLDAYSTMTSRLTNLYVEYNGDQERFGAEMLECHLLMTHMTNNAVLMIKELQVAMGSAADNDDFRKGLKGIQDAHSDMIREMLNVLGENRLRYDEKLRSDYASRLTKILPKYWSQLSAEERQAHLETLKDLQAVPMSKAERLAIKTLLVSLA